MSEQKLIARYWLSKNKCIAELSNCLAVVTYDNEGRIIRTAIFRGKETRNEKLEERIKNNIYL